MQRIAGVEKDLQTLGILFVLIVAALQKLVIQVTLFVAVHRRKAQRKVVAHATGYGRFQVALIGVVFLPLQFPGEIVGGVSRANIEYARHGVFSKQGALRPAQDFDTGNIEHGFAKV